MDLRRWFNISFFGDEKMKTHFALGDTTTDEIVKMVINFARANWPTQTAEAEAWINQQLTNYGISYAKYQAEQASATLGQYSTLLWLGGGLLLFFALRR